MYYGCVNNIAADASKYGYVLFVPEHWVNSLVGCTAVHEMSICQFVLVRASDGMLA